MSRTTGMVVLGSKKDVAVPIGYECHGVTPRRNWHLQPRQEVSSRDKLGHEFRADLAQPYNDRFFLQIIFIPRRDIDRIHAENRLHVGGMHGDLSREY